MTNSILIGRGDSPVVLELGYANRHGLIAGATGTGKTVTLQILAEGFSRNGVPVFMADVKGDLSGIGQAGSDKPKLRARAEKVGVTDYAPQAFPVVPWDLFGKAGHPIRTTISEMGPLLLSRLLDLNETQEGVINIAFKLADDEGLLLLDIADLRAMLAFVGEQRAALSTTYGNVSTASIGAILRRLLVLEQQGISGFFGEPALDINDFMRVNQDGLGHVNLLAAGNLIERPRAYATFLLWLLAELFEELPEVGDADKPRLVFFFDEAHLLFDNAPRALVSKVEQVVRLIRSKGVGVYFVTQNPLDIPNAVLGQLGNRVQHALRAFTPRDRKAVRGVADTFRQNPGFDAATAITELGVGEALVSTLVEGGIPSVVERTLVRPPASRLGPATAAERKATLAASTTGRRYDEAIDRHSAHEALQARAAEQAAAQAQEVERERSYRPARPAKTAASPARRSSNRQGVVEAMTKSVVRSLGSAIGRSIARGVLGSLFKGR